MKTYYRSSIYLISILDIRDRAIGSTIYPSLQRNGVYVSQIIRFARSCSSYGDFCDRGRIGVVTCTINGRKYQNKGIYRYSNASFPKCPKVRRIVFILIASHDVVMY